MLLPAIDEIDIVQVDIMADALMPPGVRSLRQMLHATAVEVLLYLTQLHCQEMLDSLVTSLNLQVQRFKKRNPNFQVCQEIGQHSIFPPTQILNIAIQRQSLQPTVSEIIMPLSTKLCKLLKKSQLMKITTTTRTRPTHCSL